MYVIINVVIPSKINRKQKELFKLLSETQFMMIVNLLNIIES